MKRILAVAALISSVVLAGCGEEGANAPPAPLALTADAMGRYCGMNVLEHSGPKGQVILDARIREAIWFSSARDAIAFTMLPEEPKDYAAVYVSDMAKAPSWEEPGATNWIDAKTAFYVVGSALRGGMGAQEAVPFSSREAASAFASKNGGRVVTFDEVPKDYVLGSGGADQDKADPSSAEDAKGHDHG